MDLNIFNKANEIKEQISQVQECIQCYENILNYIDKAEHIEYMGMNITCGFNQVTDRIPKHISQSFIKDMLIYYRLKLDLLNVKFNEL